MNAASVKIIAIKKPSTSLSHLFFNIKSAWKMFLLIFAVISSAMVVVYEKDRYRKLFAETQTLHHIKNKLDVERGQLLLEQSAWSAPARVQQFASGQLNMELPLVNAVHMIKTNGSL